MKTAHALIIAMMVALAAIVLVNGALVLEGFSSTGGGKTMDAKGRDQRYERITFGLG